MIIRALCVAVAITTAISSVSSGPPLDRRPFSMVISCATIKPQSTEGMNVASR